MTMMGEAEEPTYEQWIAKILACGKFVTKSFVIILLIVAAAMFAWLGIWFIFRLGSFIFHRYLSTPWALSMAFPIFRPDQMNELGQPLTGQTSRRIRRTERHRLPDGTIVDLTFSSNTSLTDSGDIVTEELVEVTPGLACSDFPRDIHDIRSCMRCGVLICERHSEFCDKCGRVFCLGCVSALSVDGIGATVLCKDCEAELTTPKWLRVIREFLWGK